MEDSNNLKTRALIVGTDDGWEALFIDGTLVEEGESLSEGYDRGLYFTALNEEHDLKLSDYQTSYFKSEYNYLLETYGSFSKIACTREDLEDYLEFEPQVTSEDLI